MIDIIDYGIGNIGSIQNMIKFIGGNSRIISTPEEILSSNMKSIYLGFTRPNSQKYLSGESNKINDYTFKTAKEIFNDYKIKDYHNFYLDDEIKENTWDLNIGRYLKADAAEVVDVQDALASFDQARAELAAAEKVLLAKLKAAGYA